MPEIGPPAALAPVDWGAQVNYDLWDDTYTRDDAIALHHGGPLDYPAGRPPFDRSKETHQLRRWEAWHIGRRDADGNLIWGKGWRGLAYGWAIGQTGTIYRIRGWNHYGAHAGDVDGDDIGNNTEIVPVLFILSGHKHTPSDAMLAAFAYLRSWIQDQTGNDAMRLWGHLEINPPERPTSCPGPSVMAYVRTHRYQQPRDWTQELIMSLPTLSRGDGFTSTGKAHLRADVKTAQGLLLARGHKDRRTADPETAADGLFGPGTEASTKAFQSEVGLTASGIVDRETWTALLLQ